MRYKIHRYPAELIDVVRLPDGRRITIRPLLPQDKAIMQAFVRDLSPASRRYRFFQGMRELSPAMLEHLMRVDYVTQLTLLGEVFGRDGERMIGEARYVIQRDGQTAEFAIATADAWQGQGIGKAMLAIIERSAASSGIRRLIGETLSDNARLLSLVRGAGFAIRPDEDDAGLLQVEKQVGARPAA